MTPRLLKPTRASLELFLITNSRADVAAQVLIISHWNVQISRGNPICACRRLIKSVEAITGIPGEILIVLYTLSLSLSPWRINNPG